MSSYRYPTLPLLFDGLRCLIGMVLTIGPLIFLDVILPLAYVLAFLSLIFLAFAVRLILQSQASIELSESGIASHGILRQTLSWPDMTSLKLAHYATPKRPSEGWYQLTIRGNGHALKIDSTIDGFDHIVAAADRAARHAGLELDPATGDNLQQLRGQGSHS